MGLCAALHPPMVSQICSTRRNGLEINGWLTWPWSNDGDDAIDGSGGYDRFHGEAGTEIAVSCESATGNLQSDHSMGNASYSAHSWVPLQKATTSVETGGESISP